MDTIELRIRVTEEMVRELIWHALMPDAMVITNVLSNAIAEQQELRGVSLEAYTLTGVSVTVEATTMHAELSYMRA